MKTVDLPADLDLPVEDVTCDKCDNTATYRIESHGCSWGLGCKPCVDRHRASHEPRFLLAVMLGQQVRCTRCRKQFRLYEDFYRVTPL